MPTANLIRAGRRPPHTVCKSHVLVISPGTIEKHEKSTVREFCLGRPLEQRSLEGFWAEHSAQGGWSLSARRGIEPQVRVPRPWILPARRGSHHLEKGTSNARAAV